MADDEIERLRAEVEFQSNLLELQDKHIDRQKEEIERLHAALEEALTLRGKIFDDVTRLTEALRQILRIYENGSAGSELVTMTQIAKEALEGE